MTSGPGMGPYRLRVELALIYTTPSQSEIGRSVGLGIFTLCGEVSILVTSVFVLGLSELYMCGWVMILGWDPIVSDDGYFMYDRRPMSDQR